MFYMTASQKTKIIFLDFDGTVYSHASRSIPESTIEAINGLKEKGILVYLCSGRSKYEMKAFDLSRIDIDGMVLTNGQVITDMEDNILYEMAIEGELKEILVDMFREKKIPIYFAANDSLTINYVDDKVIDTQNAVSTSIPTIGEYNGETFYMCSAFTSSKEQYDRVMELKKIAEVTFWHEGVVDIVPKGASKAVGIDKVLEMHGIALEDTMGIGDGDNDYEMLEHCAIGIAMGNSRQMIKDIADYVTDDIDDDGLYNALRHYGLI